MYKQFLEKILSVRFQDFRRIWSAFTRDFLLLYSMTRTWGGECVAWVLLCPEVLYLCRGEEWLFITLLEAWTVFKEVLCEPVVTQLNTKIRAAIHIFLCRYGICTSCNFLWSVINKYLASYISNQQVDGNHSCKHTRSAKNMSCLCNSVISRNCITGNIEGIHNFVVQ